MSLTHNTHANVAFFTGFIHATHSKKVREIVFAVAWIFVSRVGLSRRRVKLVSELMVFEQLSRHLLVTNFTLHFVNLSEYWTVLRVSCYLAGGEKCAAEITKSALALLCVSGPLIERHYKSANCALPELTLLLSFPLRSWTAHFM